MRRLSHGSGGSARPAAAVGCRHHVRDHERKHRRQHRANPYRSANFAASCGGAERAADVAAADVAAAACDAGFGGFGTGSRRVPSAVAASASAGAVRGAVSQRRGLSRQARVLQQRLRTRVLCRAVMVNCAIFISTRSTHSAAAAAAPQPGSLHDARHAFQSTAELCA